ncbi:MAG: hypothetical protein ABR568_12220 [Pyrinomonadaceae bacterium]
MKRCPSCNRTYTDISLNFCLEDGTPLVSVTAPSADPNATVRYAESHRTSEPPPTEIYQQKPLLNQVPEMIQPRQGSSSGQPARGGGPPRPQWSPAPQLRPQEKSNAVWWVIGGIAVVGILGIGLIIMMMTVTRLAADNPGNNNANTRVPNTNRSANANANRTANANSNTSSLPASVAETFSEEKWRTGNFQFGDIWYKDGEYHMRSKERTYLVMYAPSSDFATENATVRVTTRSVDGTGPTSGYGLIVHGQKSPSNELEDYALLIFTGDEPRYQVVMHKGGNQKALVPWTKSALILSGTSPNQLEIRTKGDQLRFYINGRYLTRITDNENPKRGVAGLYTSETSEVVFDDLEITR